MSDELPTKVPPPPGRGQPYAPDDISMAQLALLLLRRRTLLICMPIVVVVLVVVATLLWPRRFTVETSFVPRTGASSMSGAASLAARFGVAIPPEDPSQSPEFYGQLLASDAILREVAARPIAMAETSAVVPLSQVFGVDGGSPALDETETTRRLRTLLRVAVRPTTGVLDVRVTTAWPDVSLQIATNLIEVVDDFARSQLRRRAAAERSFMQERVDEAQGELREAERALERFMVANRRFQGAPELELEHDRLGRAVAMRQEVYTSLVQALDNSRLDEARNTPLITLIEPPRLPVLPDRRHLMFKTLVAGLVGLTLAVAIAVGQMLWGLAVTRDPELGEEVAAVRAQLRQWWARSVRTRLRPRDA